jgi:hypothetical protein
MTAADLSLADIDHATGGRLGATDIPCPLCGPSCRKAANRRRLVMRIWRIEPDLATFHCCRCGERGYARDGSGARRPIHPEAAAAAERARAEAAERDRVSAAERTTYALKIWHQSILAAGTLVETYLRSRGITLPPPPTLRFHPRLYHRPSGSAWPAMVALVTRGSDRTPVAIQRTFLARDGSGKAPIDQNKMALVWCLTQRDAEGMHR